tara:strand:- start:208 stop:843 length:636 start_codon:yes stop_codon:yes gene_type:complete
MAKEETQEVSPYEKLTQRILSENSKHKSALEDAVTHAWSDHVRANPENQGDGLGEKLYGVADEYVRKQLLGLEGALQGNDDFKSLVEDIIENTVGIDRGSLIEMYKSEKVVHRENVDQSLEKMAEGLGKFVQGSHSRKVKSFVTDDLSGFQDYIVELAQKVGLTEVTKDKMPTEKETISMYNTVIQLYGKSQSTSKMIGALNEGIGQYGTQ